MNKTAIKNFAVWARTKLEKDIKDAAGLRGVGEKGIAQPLPQSTDDLLFLDIGTREYAKVEGKTAIAQRKALIDRIKSKESEMGYARAYNAVIEEIAYTWFNRLIAIRFMEVNDYLPSRVRVLSSENPAKNEPDFVTNPFDTDLEFSTEETDRIYQLKDDASKEAADELFRMLFIKQCNKLHDILPGLFEKTNDYTELLFSLSYTDSILQTKYRPVIRFEGSHTAASLYGFMEMSKTVDQSKTVSTDEEGKAITDTFASYVLANKKCPSCGKPMKMQKSKKGKFFLACTGYPACHETALIDVDLVERYFYRHGGTGQHCTRCNCSLEAKLGQYGLYIQCCGSQRHRYKLDEI